MSDLVIFQPHPGPQRKFMSFPGRFALIGGAANGGKTECLRWYPWKQVAVEDERIAHGEITSSIGRAIIFRRTMPELRELIDRCRRDFHLVANCSPDIWNENNKTFTLPNGYKIMLGAMEDEKDWQKYYGFEFTYIGWDELTTFTEEQFDQLDTRLRSADPVLSKMLWNRSGTNPVGSGLEWVRRRFVEVGEPNKSVIRRIKVKVRDEGTGKERIESFDRKQIFIPAKVTDNKSVDAGEYTATLSDKSNAMRRQLLEGDWYVSVGAWAGELWDPAVHVCKPFTIPRSWYKFRSGDYGHSWPGLSSIQWWAVDPDANMVCYRSFTCVRHNSEMLAYKIKEIEMDNDEWDPGRGSLLTGPLDSHCWAETGTIGPSIAETMMEVGVSWQKCTKDRQAAAEQMRIRLIRRSGHPTIKEKDGTAALIIPGIRWFNTCWSHVRNNKGDKVKVGPVVTIPTLQADEDDPDVPDTKGNDHDYDSASYACMSRPLVPDKAGGNDPDELEAEELIIKKAAQSNRMGYPGMW